MIEKSIEVLCKRFCSVLCELFALKIENGPEILRGKQRNDKPTIIIDKEFIQILEITKSTTDTSIILRLIFLRFFTLITIDFTPSIKKVMSLHFILLSHTFLLHSL